ncbi:LytR/AlgR family response regulator transcription factor [Carboxylicivirga linearis]|uniref:Response regulator transcription factor n=1 Tax=Carboxylicivirga linearis TaxID=1628157 RepID=A0ABS5JWG4_9BACT|nr:LytTR family DNA-binding domain-containing protein [Carboxylicivirga linearis]MBS2099169.1 response regulator transcription factor [Carboxylicivirga linearis]
MRVLIIEDETAAYENLLTITQEIDPTVEVVGNTESIRQTVKWINENPNPDLIFMDIHLSDGSAFEIFNLIEIETPIIFTTAYDEHAIEAFKVNSIDYLLKPIKPDELERALTKFKKLNNNDVNQYLKQLLELKSSNNYAEKILVPYKDQLLPINVSEIACFYTSDKNTFIYLTNGQKYSYSKSLEQIITTLAPDKFIRANKQFIVSRESVKNITIWFDNRLLITLNTEVPERIFISKNKASEFKNWIVKKN